MQWEQLHMGEFAESVSTSLSPASSRARVCLHESVSTSLRLYINSASRLVCFPSRFVSCARRLVCTSRLVCTASSLSAGRPSPHSMDKSHPTSPPHHAAQANVVPPTKMSTTSHPPSQLACPNMLPARVPPAPHIKDSLPAERELDAPIHSAPRRIAHAMPAL